MAREHVQAMGEPDGDPLEPRRRRAQERARREREKRLTQALSEYESVGSPNLQRAAMDQAPLAPPQACTFYRQFMSGAAIRVVVSHLFSANPKAIGRYSVRPRPSRTTCPMPSSQ